MGGKPHEYNTFNCSGDKAVGVFHLHCTVIPFRQSDWEKRISKIRRVVSKTRKIPTENDPEPDDTEVLGAVRLEVVLVNCWTGQPDRQRSKNGPRSDYRTSKTGDAGQPKCFTSAGQLQPTSVGQTGVGQQTDGQKSQQKVWIRSKNEGKSLHRFCPPRLEKRSSVGIKMNCAYLKLKNILSQQLFSSIQTESSSLPSSVRTSFLRNWMADKLLIKNRAPKYKIYTSTNLFILKFGANFSLLFRLWRVPPNPKAIS